MLRVLFCLALICCGGTHPKKSIGARSEPPSIQTTSAVDKCPRAYSASGDALRSEVACLLSLYLQINTSNPPGNELASAHFIKQVLARDGITSSIYDSAPGRANLVARISGQQSGAATVLLHHMDVVPANATDWEHEPFAGRVDGDTVWGRGAIDNKGVGIAQVLAAGVMKRLGLRPLHDVVLVAVADEETGGAFGSRWLLESQPELFSDVAAVLNEGGAIVDFGNGPPIYSVEVAQKAPLWLRLSVRGRGGHGSTPTPDAATHKLIAALERLRQHRFAILVIPEVKAMYVARAAAMPKEQAELFRNLEKSLKNEDFRRTFMADPQQAALVQPTVSITELRGSESPNVLPTEASAVLDVRILPGQQPDDVVAEIERVLDEESLSVERMLSWEAHSSTTNHPMFEAIRAFANEQHPGSPVVANVIGGFTDCNAFRAQQITCYGFVPFDLSPADFPLLHGPNERISAARLSVATERFIRLLTQDFDSD